MSGASLSVPGVLHVGMSGEADLAVLHVGPAVGWVTLKGIHTWSREISIVFKADVSESLCRDLGVTLPEAQPETTRLPHARRAALASTLVAVESALVDALVAKGVRVHTIGSDRITGGFYYFAKGGTGAAVRVQGNLVEMVAPALATSADNAALEACLDDVIARMLTELSDGMLSEAQIELAAALPALGEAASEADAKLQTLEGFLIMAGARATKYEDRARAVVEALGQATRRGEERADVPLFGDARRVLQPELEIEYAEGESGAKRKLTLPERSRWFVAGVLPETMPPPAVEDIATAQKAATDRAAAERAAVERAAAERVAAERVAAEKVAAERAAAERVTAEKVAAERAAAERAAAERVAAEKAAAERATLERVAAEKAAAEKVIAAKEAAEKADADRLAAARAAAEKARVSEKAEKDKASAAVESRTKQAVTVRTRPDAQKSTPREKDARGTPVWVWLVLVFAAALGAYYFAVMRHHG
jgi:hypothetical protein